MKRLVIAALGLALAACQTKPADTAASATQPAASTVSYACADGTVLTAVTNAGGDSVELKFADGATLTLPRAESASGARYMNAQHEFWNKGEEATYTVGRRAPTLCTIAK
jgi:membrane-bound inhibitor of C-type lysozyme